MHAATALLALHSRCRPATLACNPPPHADCSDLLDPTDPSQFGDGIHPVAKGQALVTSCLRAALAPWLGEQPGAAGG